MPAVSTNMSVIAPTELRIDSVCCVGLSSHGTLLLHNPTTHWMRVKLAVAQININGQPADHYVSPFVVRPKVTIDPNATESVKVVDSLSGLQVNVCPLSVTGVSDADGDADTGSGNNDTSGSLDDDAVMIVVASILMMLVVVVMS